jgi:ABC-2 type transport system ATP-binding protein
MEIVATEMLQKDFGAVRALNGLSLRMSEGVFGFIGVNGAGKTTTIKILVGALNPDGGKARVLGYDCVDESLRIRKRIGVLHEKPSFPRNTSGLDYLIFVARLYGLSQNDAKKRSREIVEELGLSAFARRTIDSYSAGMKQRLGLAQALVSNPELVILDEPTSNLDPIGRGELLGNIRKLHMDKGVSFLISSHILPELQTVCDQVGVIHNGVMLEQGEIQQVVQKYAGRIFKVSVSKPDVFLNAIQQSGLVDKIRIVGDTIWISTKEPVMFQSRVMEIVHEKKLSLSLFQHGDLESALKNLLESDRND